MSLHLCVIGVGLIGGSFARALRLAMPGLKVTGCGRSEANLQRAVELGVIDQFYTNVEQAVSNADIILLAVPLGAMKQIFSEIAQFAKENVIITDVGSSKVSVLEEANAELGSLHTRFVAGHPIAGTEHSGVEASFAELFQGKQVILTPQPDTDQTAFNTVRDLWESIAAEVSVMDPEHHDITLAATSHMPHVLAFNLVNSLARMDASGDMFRYAAGGFQDFSRIASSDPVVWRDICLSNDKAILSVLTQFSQDLEQLRGYIEKGDGEALGKLFSQAKKVRDDYLVRFSNGTPD